MKFGCKIENGKLLFNRAKDFADYCKTLIGKELVLDLDERKNKRSDNQNAYYHGVVIETLYKEMGLEREEVHIFLKQKFIPKKFFTFKGQEYEVVKSTTKLSTKEFKEYVEAIQRWASSEGYYIPDPNEIL